MTALAQRCPSDGLTREQRRTIFYLKTDLPVADRRLRELAAEAERELTARTPLVAGLVEELGFAGTVSPLARGSFHVVHRVAQPDGRSLVVRSTLSGLFADDHGVAAEAHVRRWLAGSGVSELVPAVHATGWHSRGAPFDFAVQAYVAQPSIAVQGDALLDENANLLAGMGEVLRSVHAVEGEGAGPVDFGCDDNASALRGMHAHWRDYITLRLQDHVRICTDAALIDARVADRILNRFELLDASLQDRPMRLLHGDPGIHNFCADPASGRITALLDWEDVLVGDPLFEVAMVATFQPERRMPAFLAGYGMAEPDTSEQMLTALYFLRIALSKTVHRLRFGIKDRPDRMAAHCKSIRGSTASSVLFELAESHARPHHRRHGFLGSYLVADLVARGEEVLVLVRPGSDLWRLADLRSRLRIIEGSLDDLARLRPILAAGTAAGHRPHGVARCRQHEPQRPDAGAQCG